MVGPQYDGPPGQGRRRTHRSWPVRGGRAALLWCSPPAFCLAVGLAADPAGRLLALPAAALLAAAGLRDLLLQPVLRADREELAVRVGLRWYIAAWADVVSVRVVTDRRAALLEVDLGGALVVLGRGRLGRPAQVVADELAVLRPS